MTVKRPVVVNEKTKTKVSIVSNWIIVFYFHKFIYWISVALYSASDFTGFSDSYAVPAGGSDVIFTGSVNINRSTGITQQVFDTLAAALKCIHLMESNKSYSLSPNKMLLLSISGLNFWF